MARKYREYVLSTDVFNKPLVIKDRDAISTLLIRLFLMEPGENPNRPEMGIGLRSRFRYISSTNNSLKELMEVANEQIAKYLPEFQAVDVKITIDKDNKLTIDIAADDTLYKFETEVVNNNINLKSLFNQ